jgi:curved DNA-binding protein CbpA
MNQPGNMTVQQAYRVLNVAEDASAPAVKQAHRKLLKRWHPDLQGRGAKEQAEATEMTRLINEAYAAIQHAPLRYQRVERERDAGPGQPRERTEYVNRDAASAADAAWREYLLRRALRKDADEPPRMDRVEFWVRFVCGAIFGCFVAFATSVEVWRYPSSQKAYPDAVTVPIFLLIVAGCGYASARLGDKFWYAIFGVGRSWDE